MEDIACNGCSLLCDDIVAEIDKSGVKSYGLCLLGFTHLDVTLKHKISGSTDDKLDKAVKLLTSTKNPLVFGFSHASNEAIKEGLSLTKAIGGHFDSTASLGTMQSMMHDIHSLKLEADLEYVRNHGEFIIYWGSDPAESVHRHPSRFAVLPRGERIPEGVESRTIGVVDVRETETMKIANHRMIIPQGTDIEFLEAVIGELEGKASITGPILGIPAAEVIGFVTGFKKSDCSVIFYGSGLVNSGKAEENLTAIERLIEAIRKTGKEAYAFPMYAETNLMGIVKETGGVPGDLQKIVENEFSVVLVVGDDPLANLPGPAAKALAKTDIVYVGPPGGVTDKKAKVSIHTNDLIIQGSETMTRLDQVDIAFKPWKGMKQYSKTSDVLAKLNQLLKSKA
ncbi:MAG: hypothetical protein ACFFCP_04935 [Promethearchaeota archaeon]